MGSQHHEQTKRIRQALSETVAAIVSEILRLPTQSRIFYRVIPDGFTGWSAHLEHQRLVPYDFPPQRWEQAAEPVRSAFLAEAPDHIDNLIGTATGGSMRFTAQDWLRYGVTAVLQTTHNEPATEVLVDGAVAHILRFVESPRVAIRYLAPLLNFQAQPETIIPLHGGIQLRRFSSDELTALYGGPFAGSERWRTPTWGFVGEFDDIKHLGDVPIETAMADHANVVPQLERAVLALRTFKAGAVGIDAVRFMPLGFHPMGLTIARTQFHEFVPFGCYLTTADDVEPLARHAHSMTDPMHPSMELAAHRLAFTSMRPSPADRLLDAVIGLEAMLTTHDKRHKRSRFAKHLSLTFDDPGNAARREAIAKSIYDVRSAIAHGAVFNDQEVVVNGRSMSLGSASDLAVDALRHVFKRFLPHATKPPYLDASFWDQH